MKLTKAEIIWIKNLVGGKAADLRMAGEDEMANGATRSLALLMADNYQALFEKLAGLEEAWEYKIICCRENEEGEKQ